MRRMLCLFQRFLGAEFQDEEYMEYLLNHKDFEEWKELVKKKSNKKEPSFNLRMVSFAQKLGKCIQSGTLVTLAMYWEGERNTLKTKSLVVSLVFDKNRTHFSSFI